MPSPADFLPARGRAGSLAVAFDTIRPLTAADLMSLAVEGGVRASPPPLQKITAAHHHAARLLAAGHTAVETARAVGRTPQRIRDLQFDPAFKELIAYYFNQKTDAALEDEERARIRALEIHDLSMDEIRERLEDDARRREIPLSELRQIAAMSGDRTVLPPRVAQNAPVAPTNITFNIAGRGLRPTSSTETESEPGTIIDITPQSDQ